MPRSWPFPPGDRTLQLIGDPHAGANAAGRLAKVVTDCALARMPTPALRLLIGDLTEAATGGQDTTALAFANSLSGVKRALVGNHDMWNVRTGDQAATAWGLPGTKNFTYDLGFATLIGVGPDDVVSGADLVTIVLSQATLDYLDAQLAAATKDCIVACHAPLQDTVLGDTAANWTSASATYPGMGVDPNTELRAILSARPRAKVYVSGHTHSHVNLTDFVKAEDVGDRNIIALNSSALYYTGQTYNLDDPLRSIFLTWNLDNTISVRCRDHGAGVWSSISGNRVTTVAVPA